MQLPSALYPHPINLDKQDGAFGIYSGRRSENCPPRETTLLANRLSTSQNALATFSLGQLTACSLPAFIERILFPGPPPNTNFHSNRQKLKPVLRKGTHTPSLFRIAGSVRKAVLLSERGCIKMHPSQFSFSPALWKPQNPLFLPRSKWVPFVIPLHPLEESTASLIPRRSPLISAMNSQANLLI